MLITLRLVVLRPGAISLQTVKATVRKQTKQRHRRKSIHPGTMVGETGAGWDKCWLGQCPSVLNESPYCDTNDVVGEHVTTAFTGSTRIIDARFSSEISQKSNLLTTNVDSCLRVSIWVGELVTMRITVRVP